MNLSIFQSIKCFLLRCRRSEATQTLIYFNEVEEVNFNELLIGIMTAEHKSKRVNLFLLLFHQL